MLLLCFLLKCSLQPSEANKRSCHSSAQPGRSGSSSAGSPGEGGNAGALPLAAPRDLPALRLVCWGYIIAPLCLGNGRARCFLGVTNAPGAPWGSGLVSCCWAGGSQM